MTVIAIHQPNFFPWLGFFDKIARSELFILLDHVQIPKTGGTWTNRAKLLLAGEARWVTAPIVRNAHGVTVIQDVTFKPGNPWREKLIKSLSTNYAHAPFFNKIMGLLEPLVMNDEDNIARYNGTAIMSIAASLGLSSERFRWSSEIRVTERANDMLIALTRAVGGQAYMCGGGAAGYQQDAAFSSAGIQLIYQQFSHPVYRQVGTTEFVPGLSIVDALMNMGTEELAAALHVQ